MSVPSYFPYYWLQRDAICAMMSNSHWAFRLSLKQRRITVMASWINTSSGCCFSLKIQLWLLLHALINFQSRCKKCRVYCVSWFDFMCWIFSSFFSIRCLCRRCFAYRDFTIKLLFCQYISAPRLWEQRLQRFCCVKLSGIVFVRCQPWTEQRRKCSHSQVHELLSRSYFNATNEQKKNARREYMWRCGNGDENNSFLHLWICVFAPHSITLQHLMWWKKLNGWRKRTHAPRTNADYYMH